VLICKLMLQENLYIDALEEEFYSLHLKAEEHKIKGNWEELNLGVSSGFQESLFSGCLREAHIRACFEVKERLSNWETALDSLISDTEDIRDHLKNLGKNDE